jgi:hypothetical protein
MKRVVSNIQNLGFTIVNAPSEDKKVKTGGIILDQTLVNGVSEGVSVRLINGTKKITIRAGLWGCAYPS